MEEKTKNIITNNKSKKSVWFILILLLLIVVFVLVNVVASFIPGEIDMTDEKLYTLTDYTKTLLENVDDVEITALFDPEMLPAEDKYIEVVNLLNKYDSYPSVTVTYTDPDINPGIIAFLDPSGIEELKEGMIAVKHDSRVKGISSADMFQTQLSETLTSMNIVASTTEQAITGAIEYVVGIKTGRVLVLTGHNESASSEYNTLFSYFISNGYEPVEVNLLTSSVDVKTNDVLICIAPKTDLSVDEATALKTFIHGGGKLLMLADSVDNSAELTNWNDVLSMVNIQLNNDIVKETDDSVHVVNNPYAILADVVYKDIAQTQFNIVFSGSRSLTLLKNEKEFLETNTLVQSQPTAICEGKNTESSGIKQLGLASIYSGGPATSRVVVLGDAEFLSDAFIQQYSNFTLNSFQLVIGSFSWLSGEQVSASVSGKQYLANTLDMTESEAVTTTVVVSVIIPALILLAGLFIYLKRRHL